MVDLKETAPGLLKHFTDLPDPRAPRGIRHRLDDIVCISIIAVICNADTYSAIHQYALANETWLKSFLALPSGIPSQDTFERVFALLNPSVWQTRVLDWTRELALPDLPEGEDEVLAVDGKTARRSHQGGLGALHTVSVWSSQFEIVLAQEEVDDKTNEITVIPDLLEMVNPAAAVVTIDAMGTQKQIAWTVREYEAHYLLALKNNHPKLAADTRWLFDDADQSGWDTVPHSYAKTVERGHGRHETRECWVLDDLSILDPEERKAWRDLCCVVRIRSSRRFDHETDTRVQDRYFITSLPSDAARILRAARLHWGIENGLHWVLDVAFDEDGSRARRENAQANWAAIRRLAVSLLKREKTLKVGVKAKRLRAGWDRSYLFKVLGA
jgi:predicted transposase YbfD/YdcC